MNQPSTDATAWLLFTESLPPSRPGLLPAPDLLPGATQARPGLSQPGLARPGSARRGLGQPGLARAGLARADSGASIIVLADPRSGGERLGALLAGDRSLACTAGTGILELCEQAARTWRGAERTGSTLSALGAASVRAMAGTMLATIKSQHGARRWCETSAAPPRSARTFGQLYPETKIVCVHRGCAGYATAGNQDDVVAAARRWRDRTAALLELERDRPGQCLRVRHEDLAAGPGAAAEVLAFLGLPARLLSDAGRPVDGRPADGRAGRLLSAAWLLGRRAGAPLLGEINRLHAELGYPPITGC